MRTSLSILLVLAAACGTHPASEGDVDGPLGNGDNGAGAGGAGVPDLSSPPDGGADGGALVASADLFVATDGNDGWSGKLPAPNSGHTDGPLATLGAAAQKVRALQVADAARATPIVVLLRGGTYYQPKTLELTDADSGTAARPIVYAAYPGETPVVNGGVRVTGWSHYAGNVWTASLDAAAIAQPFEHLFFDGTRRMRPRLYSPTVNPQTAGTPLLGSFLRVADEIDVPQKSLACPELAKDGVNYKCGDRFRYDPGDPIAASWANLAPTPGNQCGLPAGPDALRGDIEVVLFEAWTMERMRVSCVDTVQHVVYFTAPTIVNPDGKPTRGPVKGHRYMVENVKDVFVATHVPGTWFLDRSTPTWTLAYAVIGAEDPNASVVVVPQAQPILRLSGARFVQISGITFEMDNYIPAGVDTPDDTRSRFGDKKPIDGFNIDENGENWLPGAVDCSGCQDVLFDGVTIRHTSANGLQIASADDFGLTQPYAPARDITVQGSFFYDIGSSGIHVGNVPDGRDVDGAVVQNVDVHDNLIQGYSRVFADGEGLAQGNGHHVTYAHNDITDGYHAGISICNLGCPARDHDVVSSYNHIWDIMKGITADGGTLYYNTGGQWGTGANNVIDHNLVHDVTDSVIIDDGVHGSGYGGEGIYLDVQTGDVDVTNNVVFRVSGAAVHLTAGQILGAPANRFVNNVFAYARQMMFFFATPWPEGCPPNDATYDPTRSRFWHNIWYFDRTWAQDKFAMQSGCMYACGLPFDRYLDFQTNQYWRVDGGFATDAHQFHALIDLPPGADPRACDGTAPPGDWMSFGPDPAFPGGDWQDSYTTPAGTVQVMQEDPGGKIAKPMFLADPPVDPKDFQLVASQLGAFDASATNDTVLHAGRTDESVQIPTVPDTFPTYRFTNADF